MINANPSLDPANNGSLTGAFQHVLNKFIQKIDGVLPAVVLGFDRQKNIAQVKPLISQLTTNNQQIPRAQIASVPVYQIGGGGFSLNFNLLPGDQGLLIACDRDISLYLQYGSQSPPNTNRVKNFSDSFFLPMIIRGNSIASEDSSAAVIQNLDGSVKISLQPNKIKLTSLNIEINGNLIVNGSVSCDGDISSNGDINVDGRAIVLGDIASGNNITAVGTITPNTPIPP